MRSSSSESVGPVMLSIRKAASATAGDRLYVPRFRISYTEWAYPLATAASQSSAASPPPAAAVLNEETPAVSVRTMLRDVGSGELQISSPSA